jgi:hypothetical protein
MGLKGHYWRCYVVSFKHKVRENSFEPKKMAFIVSWDADFAFRGAVLPFLFLSALYPYIKY